MTGTLQRHGFCGSFAVAPDHPAFAGHFPGRPILPGVALLAEVLEIARREPALAACIGSEPRLVASKFLAAVGPGARLAVSLRLEPAELAWSVHEGERMVASGRIARADLDRGTRGAAL